MRLRHSLTAAAGALLLTLAVPNSAQAATGDFLYMTAAGESLLADPTSGVCLNLDGATEDTPVSTPKNFTNATATVFLDLDCNGDTYYVMNPGKKLGDRLKLRSVIFS
ncbi:hypothetical protein CFP65_7508 [Kitasatospora sp. MMS16-BH015]|uniref:hypothetical protein n=1 Tax=Kitasatospora sp. MMS16-BH015 TaxID=2018025 RepID=UPI000CA0FE1C|nr:hypothetical protein [Kitasatospora sp. MMS16-BH015]AUG82085.1 hypothetical protein CFP65_7508 [Kitasatospora sp. MMS16-BH015]